MIQVVTKKFQYKKSVIKNEDTKTHKKSLTLFKKSTKKSPTLKTKAVTPRFQAISSKIALPFRAKRRLSLNTPAYTSTTHVTISKMGSKTPKVSVIPQPKTTPWKETFRKSSVKEVPSKKSIGIKLSSLSEGKKSLTRRSRNKLASDESERLRMSSCTSYSPLNTSLSREISSEDDNIFPSDVTDKSNISYKNDVPKEKTPIQRRSIKSKSETKVLQTKTRKSLTYSTSKHSSTTKKISSSAKTMKDLSAIQNASPIKVLSARKSLNINTNVASPRARKSLKFNKSGKGTFEFSGLEEEIFARSQLSVQLDSTDTDDSISDVKNVSARKSSKNRSRKSLNISQPESEITDISAIEKYPSSSRISSAIKSLRTPVARNSIKSNKSSTDCSMSPLMVSSPTKSVQINQSKIDDFNNSDVEINFSPTRVSSTRKSAVVSDAGKAAAMDQSSISNSLRRKSFGRSINVNQSGDESLENAELEESGSLEISSISRKSTKSNKSMKEVAKRSGDVSNSLNTSSIHSEIEDLSPAKASINKSLQSNVSRSAKMNVSQVHLDVSSPRVPSRKSMKTPQSTKDTSNLNISKVSSVGSVKISPRKSIRDIKTPKSAQTSKSIKKELDTSEINNVFSRISPRKSLKSHISRQSTKISQEENRSFENSEIGENFIKTTLFSPRKSIKSLKVVRNSQSTDDDLVNSEIENASPSRVSSQRKAAAQYSTKIDQSLVDNFITSSEIDENVSPVRAVPSRKSLKTPNSVHANQSLNKNLNSSNKNVSHTRVSSATKKPETSRNVSVSSSEVEDNLSPVPSARKSLKSRSLNRDKSLGSSDVEEHSSPTRNSFRKSTKTPSSTKANQSTQEPFTSSENTSISSTRASLKEKHSISGSRRSEKSGLAINVSLNSSIVEDNLSPVPSARKSLKSRSLNRDKSLGSSDVEEHSSSARNSIRKSTKTPSSTKANQSTQESFTSSENTSISSTRASLKEKHSISESRRSGITDQLLHISLSNSEFEDNFSPVRPSARKSLKSRSLNRDKSLGSSDFEEHSSPARNSLRKSTNTPSSTKANQSAKENLDSSENTSISSTRVSLKEKQYIDGSRRSGKTGLAINVSLSSSEVEDNLSPVPSARKSLKSRSLNRDKSLGSSDVEEHSSPARNSLRKSTKTPSSTKANQSTQEPFTSSENTSISSTRASLKEKHSISESRRSGNTDQLLHISLSNSEFEDNFSPVRPSARKSLKSRSLNRDKSLGSSDFEEHSSPPRNSLRKSTNTPSSTKANQSAKENLDSSENTSISSTRVSLKEKRYIDGSRRSGKSGLAINVSLSSSEVEDNLSPVPSARKSLKSRSLNRDKSLGTSDVEEHSSPARNSLRKSTKTPSSTKANQSTQEPFTSSENTSISSTRASLKEKHSISGTRRSGKTDQLLDISLSNSELEDNFSPVRPSSARKSLKSRSLNRDKSLGISDAEEYSSPARNSLRKSTKTPSSTKANQSAQEPLNNSENTSISSVGASHKDKHSISMSRRSGKTDQLLNVSLSSSEFDDNLSPVRSSGRKSLKSRSLNRDKSLGISDVEEYSSPARNALRKSIKTPSSTKANQSTQEPHNSSENISISSTRASRTEKHSSSGYRRSKKTGEALNVSLSNSEVEDNFSPTGHSSAIKSLKWRSLNRDKSLGISDVEEYSSPARNSLRKSTKTPSSTKANQTTQELINISENTSMSSTRASLTEKHSISGYRRSGKTGEGLNVSLSSSEIDDNVSPVRPSSRKSIQTPGSVERKSGIKMGSDKANSSKSAKRSKSMNQSVDSLDRLIYSSPTKMSTSLNLSKSAMTDLESEELKNPRVSSTRKSASKSRRSVKSFLPDTDLGTSFDSLDMSNVEYNQSSVEAYSVSPLKSIRKPISPKSSVKLDHIYSRRTDSISNINSSIEDIDSNISSLSTILNNNQARRSSRTRKSTAENDFDYSSSSRKYRDSDTGSGNYSLSSTIPLQTDVSVISITTSRRSSNIADESTLENVTNSLDTSVSSRRVRSTNFSVVDLTTPTSPKRSRKSSVQYQPITEDITPVTPLANTKDEAGFKTPQNTPHVFENIRKSVLKSRSRHRLSAGNDSIRKNVLNAGEALKRPRESTGSVRSNKRMKLTTSEDSSYIDSLSSSFDSEVFEADTPKLTKNISVHQPNFSSRFSAEPSRKKSAIVRRSLQVVTNVENSKPVSTPPVSKKINQKGPKNDLSDVEGVKKLMKTPKTHKEPANDLSNVSGVKNLLKTPKVHKEPKNDLTNVAGVKKLLNTPKVQKEPKNDLTNVAGVKKLLNTPKAQKEPKNDLSNIAGVKKLLKTPKPQKEPNNDLSNVSGVKKLLKTPKVQKEPENNLINIPSFKKLFSTPKEAKSPKNDLTSVPNLRRIMSPKQQNTPKNDLTDIRGVKKLMKTPKETKEPLNDLTDVRGLKKLMRTPRTQKGPLNDLSDLEGVANIFSTSVHHRLSNTSDIENNEDLFNKLFDRKPLKTYRSKSTSPNKNLDAFGAVRKTIGDEPVVSPRVVDWIDEQKVLKEMQTEVSKPQSVQKGRKKTRVEELKDEVVPKKIKRSPKNQNSEDVQVPTISSTRRKVVQSLEYETEKDEASEEKLDTDISKEVKTTRRNRQRNEDKMIEPQKTEVIESPQSKTRGRKGKQRVVEVDKNEKSEADSLEEKGKIEVESPKPRRGRRNVTKVDDEPAIESPQTSTRNRRKVAEKVDVHDEKPAKRTRNAKKDEPKTISLDSPLKTVSTDKPDKQKSTESPKITTKGRRNATTKNNEHEEEEHKTHVDSPKVTAKGRKNKKVESIATDSPQGKSGRNKSNEDQEKPVDSPKVVSRGRRNAKVVENDVASDAAQGKTGRNKSKEVVEETVDSPKATTRGRRKVTKKVDDDLITTDSQQIKSGNSRSKKEEPVVETVDSPKVTARGRRAPKKIDSDVSSVESPKPKTKRNKRVETTESKEELSKDIDSPKIETKKKTAKTTIAEEKLVQDSPKKTTRGRPRAGVAIKNIQEELPTSNKDENADSPLKTEPTTKGKRGRGKKQDEVKKVDTHEIDTRETELPTPSTKNKKDADAVKPTRGKRKQKETEDVNEAIVTVAKRSKKDKPAEVVADNEEKESSTAAKRTRRGKHVEISSEAEQESEPEIKSKRNKNATDADKKQSSKRKDEEIGTKKSKRGKVEEAVVEVPDTSSRSTRARGKKVQFAE
ncbi:unnamed protein product [Diabrotica balteata]|uniref:Uncharacterized protein n=1 Tax=Diabrotica balteata TaxID=107213 RepID=A0A9P0GX51_DIABA|nr:unnamed protein product [Diabrotica balteata]